MPSSIGTVAYDSRSRRSSRSRCWCSRCSSPSCGRASGRPAIGARLSGDTVLASFVRAAGGAADPAAGRLAPRRRRSWSRWSRRPVKRAGEHLAGSEGRSPFSPTADSLVDRAPGRCRRIAAAAARRAGEQAYRRGTRRAHHARSRRCGCGARDRCSSAVAVWEVRRARPAALAAAAPRRARADGGIRGRRARARVSRRARHDRDAHDVGDGRDGHRQRRADVRRRAARSPSSATCC